MASNQVTVRFEGTTETNYNDRASFLQVFPFTKITNTDAKSLLNRREIYYFDSKSQKYITTSEINNSTQYFVRNYIFKKFITYYEKVDDSFNPINVFDSSGNENFSHTKDYYILNETLLVSGPVEIFATVDILREKDGSVHPSKDEMRMVEYQKNENEEYEDADVGEFSIEKYSRLTGNKISLESPYISKLVYQYVSEYEKTPIVFVESVTAYPNNQDNRGAYFRLFDINYDSVNIEYHAMWQEVLLGTHSHSNPKMLEAISNINLSNLGVNEDAIVYVDSSGQFKVKSKETGKDLKIPDLPKEFLDKLNDLNKFKKLNEPDDSEWNHLDANLSELSDTYDWMYADKDGNYRNLAVGNCRSLYRELLKKEKKLFLTSDFKLSEIDGIAWITLDAFKVNFNYSKEYDDAINAVEYPSNNKYEIIKFVLPWKNTDKDEFFIFIDGEIISSEKYSIIDRDGNNLTILVRKADFESNESDTKTATVMVCHEPTENISEFRMAVQDAFSDGKINLVDIDNYLAKLYIESEFNKRPLVPKLYLTTDEYGTLTWENKLLPAQTFYANSKNVIVPEPDSDGNIINIVKFENVNFNIKTDFILAMVDGYFIPNATENCRVPADDDSALEIAVNYNNTFAHSGDEATITLVVVKNTSAGSIADEVAKNYVNKKDAINILSHGKINLSDYAKYDDLINFSKIGHKHSEYALVDHNHDERYAMYHHTHPELIAVIAKILGKDISEEEVNKWVKKILDGNEQQLIKLLLQFGSAPTKKDESGKDLVDSDGNVIYDMSKYKIDDTKIVVNDVSFINEKIEKVNKEYRMLNEKYGRLYDDIPLLEPGFSVNDILKKIILLFEVDSVKDSQVYLESPISVKLVNGPIGGITKEKTYESGTTIQDILRDILSPYLKVEDMIYRLTPDASKTKISWYKPRYDGISLSYEILDPLNLPIGETGESLYFRVELKNADGKDCYQEIIYNNQPLLMKTEFKIFIGENEIEKSSDGFYLYSDNFDFANQIHEDFPKIRITWKSNLDNDRVYDNYGIKYGRLNSILNEDGTVQEYLKSIEVQPVFKLKLPNFYWDTETELNQTPSEIYIKGLNQSQNLEVDTSRESVIVAFIKNDIFESKDFDIVDAKHHNSVKDCFEDYPDLNYIPLSGEQYIPIYYESLDNTSRFELLMKTGKYECSDWSGGNVENKYQVLFKGFKRLRDFPLDPSCIYEKFQDAETYMQTGKTSYLGQTLAVHSDSADKNGLYIITKGESGNRELTRLATNQELVKTIVQVKELINSLDDSVKNKIDALVSEVDEKMLNQKSELSNLITETANNLKNEYTSKIENTKSDFSKKLETTKNELDESINKKILDLENAIKDIGFNKDEIDSFKEIRNWIEEHSGQLEILTGQYEQKLKDISDRVVRNEEKINVLENSINLNKESILANTESIKENKSAIKALQNAGYITKNEIDAIIGSGNLKNVVKVSRLLINRPADRDDYIYRVYSDEFSDNCVIQSISIEVISPLATQAKEFRIRYLNTDNTEVKLIPNESESEYYSSVGDIYGINPLSTLIDLTNVSSNLFNLNYETTQSGKLVFEISRDTSVNPEACTLIAYISYFNKN